MIEKLGIDIADQIDWSVPCVICIANDFTRYDVHAVNQMQRNIKLVKYRKSVLFGRSVYSVAKVKTTGQKWILCRK